MYYILVCCLHRHVDSSVSGHVLFSYFSFIQYTTTLLIYVTVYPYP